MGSLSLLHLVRCSQWPSLVCDKIQAVCLLNSLAEVEISRRGRIGGGGSCHSQWVSQGRKSWFGIPQRPRNKERGLRINADMFVVSHSPILFSPRTCSVLGCWTTCFSHAGWAGMTTAFPDGERPQEIPTLDCLLTFQFLTEKLQTSLAEIMDNPCPLSFKLLGSE